ncbi:MAG: Uma2 family endonuclease [Pirellulaceae bacterium]|nr:Uma2 family endonuclease [Pirellulaceae bacterium]
MAAHLELNTPLAPPLELRRFSVEQYHQLGEMGVLTSDDNVELLEGWIVKKMNQRPIHGFIVGLLTELFQNQLPPGFSVRCQLPITSDQSEPEPDIAIVHGSHIDFRDQHPSGSDCLLVIEVADTSLEKDRAKASIYRTAGVQEYWIVNIADKCLEQHSFAEPQSNSQHKLIPKDSKVTILIGDSELTMELTPIFD